MNEGDVSKEVLVQVLRAHGVAIFPHQETEDMMVFAKGGDIEAKRLPPFVSRRMVHYFSRKFGIEIHHFYNPESVASQNDNIKP